MSRTGPTKLVALAFSALPLAAFTPDGYTVDVSQKTEGSSVVGHCFRLLLDAHIVAFTQPIELKHGGSVAVSGRLNVSPSSELSSRVSVPRGSTFVVERVLSWRNAETSSLTPYARVNGQLIETGTLFRDTGKGEGPFRLIAIDRLLDSCDAP